MIGGVEGTGSAEQSVAVVTAAEPLTSPPPVAQSSVPALGDSIVARADEFVGWLATTTGAGVEDAVRIDRIAALERVKGALAAAQVRQTVAFAESQRAGMPSWTPERTVARSIGSQVALARHESPTRGDGHVELAQALTLSMPETLAALTAGRISEAAAEGVHRALEGMAPGLRRHVDDRLAPELADLGERSLAEAARREANAVDEGAATRRAERAVTSRRVTLRTAKDGMAYFTMLAPMAEAAGAFRAVEAEATAILGEPGHVGGASRRSAFWFADAPAPAPEVGRGEPGARVDEDPVGREARPEDQVGLRCTSGTKSQLMADVVIARLTGRAIGQPVPIEIQLVMTDLAMQDEAAGAQDGPTADASSRSGSGSGRTAAAGSRPDHPAAAFHRGGGRTADGYSRREQPGGSSGRPGHPANPTGQAGHGHSGDRAAAGPAGRAGWATPDVSPRSSGGTPARPESDATPPSTGRAAPRSTSSAAHPSSSRAAEGSRNPTSPRFGDDVPRQSAGAAKVVGAGWLPTGFARELVRRTAAAGSDVTFRRVVTGEDGRTVVGLEARRHRWVGTPPNSIREPIPILAPTWSLHRLFRGVLRRLVVVRDQSCRTPFCAAAIRAVDHVTPARRDGPTCAHNASGTCDRCNFTKEVPGWKVVVLSPPPRDPPPRAAPDPSDPPWQQLMDSLLADVGEVETRPDGAHRTVVITPTGHRYESAAPAVTSGSRHGRAVGWPAVG